MYRYTIAAGEGLEMLLAALWDAGALGVWEREALVVAWFPEVTSNVPPGGGWETEPDRDWLTEWKAGLEPVRIGRLTLTPSWHAAAHSGACTIVLDPGMAFGSGHHATTRLCLAALERADLIARRVLDVGTGTGILAITAARLGAEEVVAIDVDSDAVAVAASNATRNDVAIDLRVGSLDVLSEDGPFGVVVANLSSDLVARLATDILDLTAPGGLVILSGIGRARCETVAIALQQLGAELLTVDMEDEWIALTLLQG